MNKSQYELPESSEAREIRCLKRITWKMLCSIEKAADLYNSATPMKLAEVEEPHHLLFKGKIPLVGELVILVDLMLKLNQQLSNTKTRFTEEDEYDERLSDFDIQLVKDFVTKHRLRESLETVYKQNL